MKIGFDFDGTLLDSRSRHVIVLRSIWPKIDRVLGSNWEARYWECKLAGKSTRYFLEVEKVDSSDSITSQWVDLIEDEEMLLLDRPFLFAQSLIDSISKMHSIYLITARKNVEGARMQIRDLGYDQQLNFTGIVTPGGGAGARKAALVPGGKLDFVVGDTESDKEWAECCGARFIPVSWGFRSTQYWRDEGHEVCNDPRDLTARINNNQ